MRKLVEVGSFVNPTMKIERKLIDAKTFSEMFRQSGLVGDPNIVWIPM